MRLIPLPAFQDNYLWLLHDAQRALVVDPGDAAPVQAFLAGQGLRLEAILVTHHNADHTGGVDALRDATGAQVFGPARERIPEPLTRLAEGYSFPSMNTATSRQLSTRSLALPNLLTYGRIVATPDGQLVINGPHDALTGNMAQLCAALQ